MSPFLKKTASIAVVVAGLFIGLPAHGATSASHYGFTWTFSSDRPTGTFANGEPWVVGPVVITSITPNPSQSTTGVQNGSMKNPVAGGRQGFDSNAPPLPETTYDASLNVALALPLSLVGGDVLVSSKTVNSYPNYFETVCALTVLSSAALPGSFRTGLYGRDHAVRWNKSNINYSVLRNLGVVANSPTKASIEASLPPLPWFEWHGHQLGGHMAAWRNLAAGNGGDGKPSTYGREVAIKWSSIALWLQLNHSQADKEKALIQTIQCGIDIWSYATNGGGFYHNGGHKCGRKFPAFLAAVALNDPTLLQFISNPDIFQEDMQTFIVKQSDVGRAVNPGQASYNQSHVGMPEWGVKHRWEPINDDSRFNDGVPYRHVVWPATAGSVLAADLMGRKDAWGHPAIFAYNDRYHALRGFDGFATSMYSYKSGSTDIPPPPVGSPGAPSTVGNLAITPTKAPQTATWAGEIGTLQTHLYLLNPSTSQYGYLANVQGNSNSIQLSLPAGTHTIRAARQNTVAWSDFSTAVTVTISDAPSRPTNLRVVE